MAIVPFELPEELQSGVSAEEIVREMLARMPNEFDKTEGGFLWDFTMPTALEKAELLEFWLPLALKTMSHIWAKGRWLDYHACDAGGLERREATYAYGDVVVTTTEAVTFPQGFIFSVPSENDSPAIEFETVDAAEIDGAGELTIRVKAVEAGTGSNVKADTITIMKNPLRGVEAITNPAAMTGGTAEEDDESLRQRIDDYHAGRGSSFVGNAADYRRWALEVAGVGYVHVIPTFDGPSSVKLVIADANGDPANQEILDAVTLHIFGVNHEDLKRFAPIGARGVMTYAVVAPTTVPVNVSFNVKLQDGFTVSGVTEQLETSLKDLFKSLADDENYFSELRYVAVSQAILNTAGVADFKHLRVNGSRDNVPFGSDEMPCVGELELTPYD